MIQRTLKQARPALTQVSGMTGFSMGDPRFIERLNQAQEEIINLGDWPGVTDRWHLLFDEITGVLVLPYYLDRLYQVTVDYCPATIMSPWAEFVQYGVGPQDDTLASGNGTQNLQPRNWYSDCLDHGEVVSKLPIPDAGGPWKLRVYASQNESADAEMNLQGYYNNCLVRSQPDGTAGDWINGETLAIDNSVPFTETTQFFDKLSYVQKTQTNSCVRLVASDGTSEVELSNYESVETEPSYRSYYIRSLWRPQTGVCSRVILARARRRFVPVAEDDDRLMIGNVPALKAMLQSQYKRDAGDPDQAEYYLSTCIRILRQEASAYLGKSRTPAISMTRGFALGAMPWVH